MKISTYRYNEIKMLIDHMLTIYDLVRLVDPDECRELELRENGSLFPGKLCYRVWSTDKRCANCSSYKAGHSLTRIEKTEYFGGNTFHILSVPVEIINEDGIRSRCVMECITIREGIHKDENSTSIIMTSDGKATQDSLTGLYNWDGFCERAREIMQEEVDSEWVLILYDVIKFKLVNDIFGSGKGNELLMKLGQLISSKLSDSEICGRILGDQFVALVHKENFGDKFVISASRELPGLIKSSQYHLHIQAGVFYISDKNIPVSSMCDRARIALSTIKGDTSLHVAMFDDSIMDKMLREQFVISECERAIEEEEFQIYLQPQVEDDGRIIGAEALSRWVRPDGEIVPPREFIDILEKSDLIVKLDTYIWEQAARKLAEWKGTDKEDLYISVNISPKDFFHIDVFDFFDRLVKKYDVDKTKLKLEITETFMMRDALKQLALVNKLHNEGFEIEIDDFGKGYSSLSLLKDINADTLKIDKEFLRETDNDKKSENILGSVIDMSGRLSMNVITEGVETREQLERLVNLGCHTFQGFYFARPMSIDSFEEVWKRNHGQIAP